MRKLIPLKSFSCLLLAVTLFAALAGVFEHAHAAQLDAPSRQASLLAAGGESHCPCCPVDRHGDDDGCDTCCDCACHAPMAVPPFSYSYVPYFSELQVLHRFTYLPEVFLSKFVPPQLQA